jgi:ubiquinone/menaquinone biosynthesis C-methylase UbiE
MQNALATTTQLAAHALRIGWYWSLNQIVDRQVARTGAAPTIERSRPIPGRDAIFADLARLMRQDAAAVGDGRRPPLPITEGAGLADQLARLRAMLADAPEAARRRAAAEHRTSQTTPQASEAHLPDYFRQDFHYQSGGYLTEESARLYDLQVETLFYGAAQLMRRSVLDPISGYVRGRDQRGLSCLDVGCGTGRLLRDIRQAYPAMRLTGLDLSRTYLAEAERHLRGLRPVSWLCGNGEEIPLADASQDIVTSVFVFHELPGEARRNVIREAARVLKPGGLAVILDSLQYGDRPGWDGLLEAFPQRFHEPYYAHYLTDDLGGLLTEAGFTETESEIVFLSKRVVARKP